MRFASAIAVTLFTVGTVTKWTSATIVPKSCARPVRPCFLASSAELDSVRSVQQRVDGAYFVTVAAIYNGCLPYATPLFTYLFSSIVDALVKKTVAE